LLISHSWHNGRVSTIVASGEADIGLQQITVYSAGITANAREVEAAKAFIRFISAPAAAPDFAAKGLGS
jgi:ABC-type molybdate transport system substrate-binding protein